MLSQPGIPTSLRLAHSLGGKVSSTKIDLMTTLCGAFGVFSAFGVAILAFFTGGGGLQRISGLLGERAKKKAAKGDRSAAHWLTLSGPLIVWLVAAVVTLAVIISGVGLFTSFFWLRAVAAGAGSTSRWAYDSAEDMFYFESIVITVVTVVAVIGAAIAALPARGGTAPAPEELTASGQASSGQASPGQASSGQAPHISRAG